MRVVVGLGGNALLKRGEAMTLANQDQERTRRAVIGAVPDIAGMMEGSAGTQMTASP